MNETNFGRKSESDFPSDSNGESTDGNYENYGRNGIRNHDFAQNGIDLDGFS